MGVIVSNECIITEIQMIFTWVFSSWVSDGVVLLFPNTLCVSIRCVRRCEGDENISCNTETISMAIKSVY